MVAAVRVATSANMRQQLFRPKYESREYESLTEQARALIDRIATSAPSAVTGDRYGHVKQPMSTGGNSQTAGPRSIIVEINAHLDH
jgi:hypothetical protein